MFYVWGSSSLEVKITCADQYLLVTRNPAIALQNLRNTYEPRVLWADAISIDQADPVEQSSQVVVMSDIYRMATKVIVWLGPEHKNIVRVVD